MDTFVAYDEPQSIFSEALGMIVEENTQFIALVENNDIVNESALENIFNLVKFKKIIVYIFKKFKAIVEKIIGLFKIRAKNILKLPEEELLMKYKRELLDLKWTDYIDDDERKICKYDFYKGGRFSIEITLKSCIDDELHNIARELGNIYYSSNTLSEFQSKILILNQCIKDQREDFLDIIRQEALDTNYKIPEKDFLRELENYFIDDFYGEYGDYSDFTRLTKKKIAGIYYNGLKDQKEEATKTLNLVNRITKETIEKVNSMQIYPRSRSTEINTQVKNAFSDIIRTYTQEIQGMCNIFVKVVSYKLDLIDKLYQQVKRILLKIVTSAVKEGKLR